MHVGKQKLYYVCTESTNLYSIFLRKDHCLSQFMRMDRFSSCKALVQSLLLIADAHFRREVSPDLFENEAPSLQESSRG